MINNSISSQVVEHLEALPLNLQEQVLSLVRALDTTSPRGVPGHELVRFAGAIPKSDLQEMSDAIEAGCEGIDLNEW